MNPDMGKRSHFTGDMGIFRWGLNNSSCRIQPQPMPGMPKKSRFSIPLFLRTSKSWWRSPSFGYPTHIYIYEVSQENYSPAANRAWADSNCHGSALFETLSRATMSSDMSYLLVWSLFPSHVCELMAYGHHKPIGTSHLAEL